MEALIKMIIKFRVARLWIPVACLFRSFLLKKIMVIQLTILALNRFIWK